MALIKQNTEIIKENYWKKNKKLNHTIQIWGKRPVWNKKCIRCVKRPWDSLWKSHQDELQPWKKAKNIKPWCYRLFCTLAHSVSDNLLKPCHLSGLLSEGMNKVCVATQVTNCTDIDIRKEANTLKEDQKLNNDNIPRFVENVHRKG